MGDAYSVFVLSLFLFCGILVARVCFPREGLELTIPLGCGISVALMAALPALPALVFGFRLPAVLIGTAAAAVLTCLLWRHRPKSVPVGPDWRAVFACVVPVLLLTLWLLQTHILDLRDGAYYTGQSCYGDLALHLAQIKNIAVTGTFPPIFPLLAGNIPIGYPFLCETVSSQFLLLGTNLKLAYLLPEVPALIAVFGMAWHLARRILGAAGKACLAFWLFFMGSGFGFVYFLGSPEAFHSIFTEFYTTPTNYTLHNIVWVNPIVDLLVPQRATLFGWSVLFPALYLLWRFCMEEERQLWLPLGLLVLPLPLIQTHSALVLVLFCLGCGVYCLVDRPHTKKVLLPWLWLALLCGIVWPLIAWQSVFSHAIGGQQMIRFHFNWSNGSNEGVLTDPYFWFYIKNIGLVYLLLIPAFLHAHKKQRWWYGGALAVLALAEFVEFQTNNYDNNKLLYFWHFMGCVLVAGLLWDVLSRLHTVPLRATLATCLIFVATFGSVLTVGRELVSNYQQWSADDIALAQYVDENLPAQTLVLTDDSHLQPVVCLAGRQILCGSGTFVYFHGMDYSKEYEAMKTLYETPSEELLQQWGIKYALFDQNAYDNFAVDENWYSSRYPCCYQNGTYRLYPIS